MGNSTLIRVVPLGFPWETIDPFLFCVHHDDAYPRGNDVLGPATSLAGRDLGMDFTVKDGWRMYHGQKVPGFPQHPHRGFETVTVLRRGFIDHSDSLGATARFGADDVQWMTAGKGIVHCEMFPLLSKEKENPVELFQIWLNLPRVNKLVEPHFAMFWGPTIPRHVFGDAAGGQTEVVTVAGAHPEAPPYLTLPKPPPKSWAAQPGSDVAIWTLRMSPGARFRLPAAAAGVNRMLYFFRGAALDVDGERFSSGVGLELRGEASPELVNGPEPAELLLLQGRPIGEPVVKYGPFVMNTPAEIQQAFNDYRRTEFGGWPWPSDEPVHPRDAKRFAKHADGKVEEGESQENI